MQDLYRALADFFENTAGEDEDLRGNSGRGRPRGNGGRRRRGGSSRRYGRGSNIFKGRRGGDTKAVPSGPGLVNRQRIH